MNEVNKMVKDTILGVILLSFSVPLVIMTILWEALTQHEKLDRLDKLIKIR